MSVPGPAPLLSWEAARARLLSYCARSQADDIAAALDWFRPRITAGGPWPGWEAGYPLAAHFCATWGPVPEGVRLHRLLRRFPDDDLRHLLCRLSGADWINYNGALLEAEVAGRMHQRGLVVELIPPSKTHACPDFRAVLVDRHVMLECTSLSSTLRERKADSVFERLFGYAQTHSGFEASVAVRFVDGALAEEAFARFDEIERAIVLVADTNISERLPGLCTVEAVTGGRAGVVADGGLLTGSLERTAGQVFRALAKKTKGGQLYSHQPTVVVVRVRHLVGLRRERPLVVDWLATLIRGRLIDAPEVGGVLLVEEWRASDESVVELSGSGYPAIVNQDEDGATRLALLVVNADATHPLRTDEMDALVGHNMVW